MEKQAVIDEKQTPALEKDGVKTASPTVDELDNDFSKEAADKVQKNLKGQAYELYFDVDD